MLLRSLATGAPNLPYIEDVFSTYLYTGNGSTQTITNGIDLAGEGGLVWTKNRTNAGSNRVYDTVRGVLNSLVAESTSASSSVANSLTAFNSDGFSLGSSTASNVSGDNYVSWTFRKAAKFFDVVTYTGNGTSQSLAHALAQTVGTIFVKRTDTTSNWTVYHRSLGATKGILLNDTAAAFTSSTPWNDTEPTSSAFTIGSSSNTNASGGTYVAFLFAHDTGTDGLIQCGSFTTDGSGNFSDVSLGWEPQYILYKISSDTGNWQVFDTMRGLVVGGNDAVLAPNTSDAEVSTSNYLKPTATGFAKDGTGISNANKTFIYLAIRRGPMKQPTTGTQVYSAIARTGTGASATVTGVGFPPDLVMPPARSNADGSNWFDRLRGSTKYIKPSSTNAEATDAGGVTSFDMDGMTLGTSAPNNTGVTYINHFFRRYPGVFDQVCYTGTGANKTEAHNLAAIPELMIVKSRSSVQSWPVYSASLAASDYLLINNSAGSANAPAVWNSTSPTSSVFTVGTDNRTNASGTTYVAYLFATLAGISKVGSYTGNGTSQTIDCGFSAGARFVLIKRTDTTGQWWVFDTVRGIVAGNDPDLALNLTQAENTSRDSVDPSASGFDVVQNSGTDVNINAATYVFLAFA